MHVSSFMFKHALLNASVDTKNQFLKEIKNVIDALIVENDFNISIKNNDYFDDKVLYQFSIPTKSNTQANIYRIVVDDLQ